MANRIGRFEILSEITHSEIGAVYKAADPESGQTIALKTIQLQMLADQASVLIDHIVDTSVACPAKLLRRVLVGPAVAHRHKQIDDELLEERRRILCDAVQEVGPQD